MAKLDGRQTYTASLPRTGHDVGQDVYFSSSAGMELPIWFDLLNQGETIDFKCNMSTQANPLIRPTMLHIRQKVDLFFVPLQMLWTPFGNVFYQTNDLLSSAVRADPNYFPLLNMKRSLAGMSTLQLLNRRLDFVDLPNFEGQNVSPTNFESYGKGAFRLFMHLGLNPFSIFCNLPVGTNMYQSTWQPNVFPYQLLAYQAIYHNYYRNDEYEPREIRAYQADYVTDSVYYNASLLFRLQYHDRPKDYYTSVKVSPIMSVLNLLDNDDSATILSSVNNYLSANGVVTGGRDDSMTVTLDVNKSFTQFMDNTATEFQLTTGNIRSLFAVEKLARITGRAKKDYDSQTLAHLGFKVPRDVKHEISYLGGFDGSINVKQIESLAGTDSTELGERAGLGFGSLSGKPIRYTAPCHGVVMAITYCVPEVSYALGTFFDKMNAVTNRLDLYIPEFDKLGMQPMFNYERTLRYSNAMTPGGDPSVPTDDEFAISLGWQYRYEQYKRKRDVHTMAFMLPEGDDGATSQNKFNSWAPWVISAFPFQNMQYSFVEDNTNYQVSDITPSYLSFKASPTSLNNIFVQNHNPYFQTAMLTAPWLAFQSDNFMHACRIDCKKVSTMSVFGEPELW